MKKIFFTLFLAFCTSSVYADGQLFYFYSDDVFSQYDADTDTTSTVTGYTAKQGRQDLIYNYNHGASRSRRIDPGISNIVDIYALTKTYDANLRTWLRKNQSTAKPSAPTIFEGVGTSTPSSAVAVCNRKGQW